MAEFMYSFTPEAADQKCCKNPTNPECFPMQIPADDNFFNSQNQSCLDLRRTVPFCSMDGKLRHKFY